MSDELNTHDDTDSWGSEDNYSDPKNADWGSFENDDWEDSDSDLQSNDDWEDSDSGLQSNDGWGTDDWEDSDSDLQSNDDWDTDNSENDDNLLTDEDWGKWSNDTSSEEEQANSLSDNISNEPPRVLRHSNLGYKAVGCIVGGVLILIAFLIYIFSGISFVKTQPQEATSYNQSSSGTDVTANSDNQNTQSNSDVQGSDTNTNSQDVQGSDTNTSSQDVQGSDTNTSSQDVQSEQGSFHQSGVSLNKVDDSTLDYSGDEISAQGTILSKSTYTQNNQLVYCLEISLGVSDKVAYYCGYNVYSQVEENDIVTVKYRQLGDGYFSISNISK